MSSSITKVLGYPRDMLVGQCILDYLYPRDRLTFASYLSQSLQTRFSSLNSSSNSTSTTDDKFIFYVRIRQHKSLTGGCAVVEDRPTYRPFQLKCYIKNVLVREECDSGSEDATICLIVSATPIRSAHHRKYGQNVLELTVQSVSQECTPSMAPFSTRHTTSGHFSHMDSNGIAYLGYLPQDILGFSIFDFYHREDLTLLRDIYQLGVLLFFSCLTYSLLKHMITYASSYMQLPVNKAPHSAASPTDSKSLTVTLLRWTLSGHASSTRGQERLNLLLDSIAF